MCMDGGVCKLSEVTRGGFSLFMALRINSALKTALGVVEQVVEGMISVDILAK